MSELTSEEKLHKVGVGLGYTTNMGNFESLRVDIHLEVTGKGHPDVTFEKTYKWVEKKLLENVRETRESLETPSDKE